MLEEAQLAAGDSVELQAQGSGAILVSAKRRIPDVEELCARITPENRHPVTFTGPPVGNEVW
jgi:antitoxin component of MazEF toxin-antitoxin module